MILETERLMLREMTQSDFDDLAEMLCDPEVMYAYERDFSDEDVRQWLDNQLSRYKKYGFGMWSVILKQSGNMIGQAGITMQPYKDGELHEIGYLFKKAFWHNGYATEAAQACVALAAKLGIEELVAFTTVTNLRSQRVMQKIGMECVAQFNHPTLPEGHPLRRHVLYAAARDTFEGRFSVRP